MLCDREKKILNHIITEYINTGKPVSSRSLSRRQGMDLSPATIRNVMADLEDKGYIYQPHISAGRIPSDSGYRFYVDNMMRIQDLTLKEKNKIRDQYNHRINEIDNVLRDTSLILSKISQKIGIALVPKLEQDMITCFNFIPVSPNKLLAVLVTRTGLIKEHLFRITEPLERSSLERLNGYFSEFIVGKTVGEALKSMKESDFFYFSSFIFSLVKEQLSLSLERDRRIYVGGMLDYMKNAELPRDSVYLSEDMLAEVLTSVGESDDGKNLMIKIGAENRDSALEEYTLITRELKMPEGIKAKIAIVGEKRVNYGKIIALLDYTGKVLEDMLRDTIGEE